MLLTQTTYIAYLLNRVKLDGAKPILTLMCSSTKLFQCDGDPISYATTYRSVVGALRYLPFNLTSHLQ